jgi:hypothetical protein
VRRRIAGALLVLLAAKARGADPGPGPGGGAPAPNDSAAGAACVLDRPSLAQLGFRALPSELPRAAQHALVEARKASKAGASARAKQLLEPIAHEYPERGEVRFALLKAQAAAGEPAHACEELGQLLVMDLPAYAPALENDPALEALRASPFGPRLREQVRLLTVLWQEAAARGMPGVLWAGTLDPVGVQRVRLLRAGVYLHDQKRFLPLAGDERNAASAFLDTPRARVVTVVPDIDDCRSDFCPRITGATLFLTEIGSWQRKPLRWRYQEGDLVNELDLRSTAAGVWLAAHDCSFPHCRSPWYNIAGREGGPRKPDPEGPRLLIAPGGTQLGVLAAGYRLEDGNLELPDGRSVPLAAKHRNASAVHSVLVDPAARLALVLSVVNACECGKREGNVLYFVVSRVDLAAGRAEVVLQGDSAAAIGMDGQGAAYLQSGGGLRRTPSLGLRRWPTLSSVGQNGGETVMPGVLLSPPRGPEPNCCGL